MPEPSPLEKAVGPQGRVDQMGASGEKYRNAIHEADAKVADLQSKRITGIRMEVAEREAQNARELFHQAGGVHDRMLRPDNYSWRPKDVNDRLDELERKFLG